MSIQVDGLRLAQGFQARGVRVLFGQQAAARRRILECLHRRS